MKYYNGLQYSNDYKICYGEEMNKSIKEAILHPNTEVIDMEAFYHAYSLEKVVAKCNLKTIGISAFDGCDALKEIIIDSPNEIKIRKDALYGTQIEKFVCTGNIKNGWELERLKFCAKHIELVQYDQIDFDIFFSETDERTNIEYLKIATKNYEFENFICFDDNPNYLGAYPQGRKEAKVYVPKNIEIIEERTFLNNDFIEEIYISENLKQTKGVIFENLKNLKFVKIDSKDFVADEDIFERCPNLEKVLLTKEAYEKNEKIFGSNKKYKVMDIDYIISKYSSMKDINNAYKEMIAR